MREPEACSECFKALSNHCYPLIVGLEQDEVRARRSPAIPQDRRFLSKFELISQLDGPPAHLLWVRGRPAIEAPPEMVVDDDHRGAVESQQRLDLFRVRVLGDAFARDGY